VTMLELRSPVGAFEAVEGWLQECGFFGPGGEELCADLFLGYGLSEPLRRGSAPSPPEPCPALPLAACRIVAPEEPSNSLLQGRFTARGRAEPDGPSNSLLQSRFSVGPWEPSWTAAEYGEAVEAVRAAIAHGDVYQVNLVQHLEAPFRGDAAGLSARLAPLRPLVPQPFVGEGWAVVSASPELFLERRGRLVRTCPIKGTRPAGESDELRASPKDAAEHLMIVDLERNDLSRVCEPGSVGWPSLLAPRRLAGVEHLVSTVEGTLREGVGLAELLAATFPGGSVTGAPKLAALDLIAGLEPVGRGASMGALGRVWGNGDLELALTIRTFAVAEGRIHLWVGGGVVWDSDPAAEVEESLTKAAPLLAAIGAPLRAPVVL
jgi:para-aminobenzoate synthetase component I